MQSKTLLARFVKETNSDKWHRYICDESFVYNKEIHFQKLTKRSSKRERKTNKHKTVVKESKKRKILQNLLELGVPQNKVIS